jgi:hypothetical protein
MGKEDIKRGRGSFLEVLDGWSSLVMIPVSHTGGREFKSLPIHFCFLADRVNPSNTSYAYYKITTLFLFLISIWNDIRS